MRENGEIPSIHLILTPKMMRENSEIPSMHLIFTHN